MENCGNDNQSLRMLAPLAVLFIGILIAACLDTSSFLRHFMGYHDRGDDGHHARYPETARRKAALAVTVMTNVLLLCSSSLHVRRCHMLTAPTNCRLTNLRHLHHFAATRVG
jgi:hypothetical protein